MTLDVVHRGKCGDVVYAMAAFRGYWKETGHKVRVHLADNGLFGFPAEEAARVASLVRSQADYIDDVNYLLDGPPTGAKDLMAIAGDEGGHHVPPDVNTARYACRLLGVKESWAQEPWLAVEPAGEYAAVLNRTPRYQNARVDWPRLVADHPRGRFVGLADEHLRFAEFVDYDDYEYGETRDLLAVARVIAAGRVFIGNQSAPLAIAHGLHKPVIVETSTRFHNAIFKRPDATYLGVGQDVFDRCGW